MGSLIVARRERLGQPLLLIRRTQTGEIWDVRTGRRLAELAGHEHGLWDGNCSPDGRLVVTASDDNTARVWDSRSGRELAVLSGHFAAVTLADFSKDGRRIVTASDDRTVRIWDAQSYQQRAELAGFDNEITTAEFSADGIRILTASKDFIARTFDTATGRLLGAFFVPGGGIEVARFSPSGGSILFIGYNSNVWTSGSDGEWRRGDDELKRRVDCYVPGRILEEVVVPAQPRPELCMERTADLRPAPERSAMLRSFQSAVFAWQRGDVPLARALFVGARKMLTELGDEEDLPRHLFAELATRDAGPDPLRESTATLALIEIRMSASYPEEVPRSKAYAELGEFALEGLRAPALTRWAFQHAKDEPIALQEMPLVALALSDYEGALQAGQANLGQQRGLNQRIRRLSWLWSAAKLAGNQQQARDFAEKLLKHFIAQPEGNHVFGNHEVPLLRRLKPSLELEQALQVLELIHMPKSAPILAELSRLLQQPTVPPS